MARHNLEILQQMLQDFKSVYDHFGTLCIKGFTFPFSFMILRLQHQSYLLLLGNVSKNVMKTFLPLNRNQSTDSQCKSINWLLHDKEKSSYFFKELSNSVTKICVLVENICQSPDRSNYYGCSIKKVFLKTLQNPQENLCFRGPFLIKLHVFYLNKFQLTYFLPMSLSVSMFSSILAAN